MAIGKETTISIRRTVQPVKFESLSVEITETYVFASKEARSAAYKELSTTVERMTNFELKKWRKGGHSEES